MPSACVHFTALHPTPIDDYKANAAPAGTPWMWTLLPFGYHEDRTPTQGYAGDACRRDGGARQGLAAGMTAAPAHEWVQVKGLIAARPPMHVRYSGHENICSF